MLQADAAPYREAETRLRAAVDAWLQPRVAEAKWKEIDYYCTTLALRNGLIADDRQADAVGYLKQHMLACFPNDRSAPTLANPDVKDSCFITPYFAYYSFEELARAGEIDFVLEQMRRCWGWGLEQGLTTQPELFDLNRSHCHVWASSPTAQLTRWLLGLQPCFSRGENHYELTLDLGSTTGAAGHVPLLGQSGAISIQWRRVAEGAIEYQIDPPAPIWMHWGDEVIAVDRKAVLTLAVGCVYFAGGAAGGGAAAAAGSGASTGTTESVMWDGYCFVK